MNINFRISSELWGLGNYCRSKIQDYFQKGLEFNCRQDYSRNSELQQEPVDILSDSNKQIIEDNITYLRSNYNSSSK